MGRLTEFFGLVEKTLDVGTRARNTSYLKRARYINTLKVNKSGDSVLDPHALDYLLLKRYRKSVEKNEQFSLEHHHKLNDAIWKRLEKKEMEQLKELQKRKK